MSVVVGEAAPDLALVDQHGRSVTLSSFRGEKAVVVMFYPFAFSGVCTSELGEVRDRLPDLQGDDAALLAVSCDPMFALRAFADAERLTFPLLSDFWPHGEVARRYGTFDEERGCALRGTYVVDRDGKLVWTVENGLPEARDLGAVVAALAAVTG